jgi:hypothetical protein
MRSEVVDARGPQRIPGHEDADADGAGRPEPSERLGAHEPRPPALQGALDLGDQCAAPVLLEVEPGCRHRADDGVGGCVLDHGRERRRGAEDADDRPRDTISGLGDARPRAARRGLVGSRVGGIRVLLHGRGAEGRHELTELIRRESEPRDPTRTRGVQRSDRLQARSCMPPSRARRGLRGVRDGIR